MIPGRASPLLDDPEASCLAAVWAEASWVSGPADQPATVQVRGLLVWRKEPDGVWRVAMEHLG